MKKILYIALLGLTLSSCSGFLNKEPKDIIPNNKTFWNDESSVRASTLGFYTTYFPGYRSGWTRSDWFSETNIADWTDDNAQNEATMFTKNVPTSTKSSKWDFSNVRDINVKLENVMNSSLPDEAKKHWMGVFRFFRAMEYANLVSKIGAVPYFDKVIDSKDENTLYKQRDSRTYVMDKVLEDLNYACENVRAKDGVDKLSVNKDVVYAFKSRIMLFEGTWEKYRENNNEYAIKYLQEAKSAADFIMKENKYKLCDNYKDLTTSESLATNPEIILYRAYVEGVITNSIMAFQNTDAEKNSPSKSLIESYLTTNGLPITQVGNTDYQGDKEFRKEMRNRDPRLSANIDTSKLYLTGIVGVYAVSGYFGTRFLNEALKNLPTGRSTNCIIDAPIMKLNEVLMNYIEAVAELQTLGAYTLTQDDFDRTINVIRDRKSTHMPHLTLAGQNLSVNGVVINDPDREVDVPSIIWEIRRERRVELVYEGKRFNDIRRWNKLYYADMILNPKINLGAWLDKDKYVAWYNSHLSGDQKPINVKSLDGITLDREGNAGYIKPITDESLMRRYNEKDYLYPLPLDQITLYKEHGVTLNNNPGW